VLLGARGVAGAVKPPHVLFLLADDFGWHNSGHRGDVDSPEVVTPNLRALTQQGLLLNRHYAYKICSPTRCSLQTGKLSAGNCPAYC
jgi:arylsulfatase B